MMDFAVGEPIRLLPCMHFYHVHCIDDWLLRSMYCPTCMEPVDRGVMESMRSRSRTSSQATTPLSSGQQTPICVPSTPLTPPLSPAIPLRWWNEQCIIFTVCMMFILNTAVYFLIQVIQVRCIIHTYLHTLYKANYLCNSKVQSNHL